MKYTRSNQSGMVSIIVTMIIMIVLTLIVTGFAQLSRREQRQALDRQLGAQALYAAESGRNDAKKLVDAGFAADVTSCDASTAPAGLQNRSLGDNVSYTCVLIDQSLDSKDYQNVGVDAVVTSLKYSDGSAIGSFDVQWRNNAAGGAGFPGSIGFTPKSSWTYAASVLRVELVPLSSISRASLRNNARVLFLFPVSSGGSNTHALGASGEVVATACSGASCTMKITGVTDNDYALRISSLYAASDITLYPAHPSKEFIGDQYEVDVTGRAGDVLKRVKTRESKWTKYPYAQYVFEGIGGVCKQLAVWPGGAEAPGCTIN